MSLVKKFWLLPNDMWGYNALVDTFDFVGHGLLLPIGDLAPYPKEEISKYMTNPF